jgi:hypothetical protein
MVKTLLVAAALSLAGPHAYAADDQGWYRRGQVGDAKDVPELWNTPDWVLELVGKKQFDRTYRFIARLNPYYLRGDFNGDGRPDMAVLIERLSDKKQGIAIFHFGESTIRVVGAGRALNNGEDEFSWMDAWQVWPKMPVGQGVEEGPPPKLRGEALYVEKTESASAIIYWNGQKYLWYQQGD